MASDTRRIRFVTMKFDNTRAVGFLLTVGLLILTGCSSSETLLMPTPNIYAQPDAKPFAEVPPALQSNKVDVLYLTDRQAEKSKTDSAKYGFKRSRSVAFGVSEVEIGSNLSWDDLVHASTSAERKSPLPLRVVKTTELLRYPETP